MADMTSEPFSNKFTDYLDYDRRLASFVKCSKQLLCRKEKLAAAGFFYTRIFDQTRCFNCGVGCINWTVDAEPWQVHARYSRTCEYVISVKGSNYVTEVSDVQEIENNSNLESAKPSTSDMSSEQSKEIINAADRNSPSLTSFQGIVIEETETSAGSSKRQSTVAFSNKPSAIPIAPVKVEITERKFHVKPERYIGVILDSRYYNSYNDRLDTFNTWPKMLSHLEEKLALAGFYYTNRSDATSCDRCGIIVTDWGLDDDPWDVHYKHSKDCIFLINLTKSDYEAEIIKKRLN